MILIALLIGAVLIVAAIRGTHGELAAAIRQDVPAFAIWGAAIFGVAVIGFVPGLKPVSRGLLALLVVVIVLTNYQRILAAFQGAAYGAAPQAAGAGVQVTGYSSGASGGNGGLYAQLAALVGDIQSGASADYGDLVLPSGGSASEPEPVSQPAKQAAQAAPVEVSESMVGGANPIAAVVNSVVSAVSSAFGRPEPGGPDPWLREARIQQFDYSVSYEQEIANRVASGQLVKGSEEYQSQLAYMANLRGGVATADAEMARLKAAGF